MLFKFDYWSLFSRVGNRPHNMTLLFVFCNLLIQIKMNKKSEFHIEINFITIYMRNAYIFKIQLIVFRKLRIGALLHRLCLLYNRICCIHRHFCD